MDSTVVSMFLTILLVLTGTWVYLWQLFGAANQLMAALSLHSAGQIIRRATGELRRERPQAHPAE